MQNNHYDLLCAATGGFFMLLSFTVMFYSLFKWCRSRNNQSQTTTCRSAEPQCANIPTIIPVIVYEREVSTVSEYDNECSICLAEFEEGERLRVLPNCKHVFHVVCIDQWIPVRSLNCPVCRDRTIHNDSEPVRTGCGNDNNLSSAFVVVNFAINRL